MKLIILVLVVVLTLCFVEAHGRHVENEYDDLPESEGQTELENRMRDHTNQMRHRRRSRQMYAYDYPPPYVYLDHRRDTNNRPDEVLSNILKTLDEILNYMRRAPPPPPVPQPVYIPYPVYQSRPCNCRGTTYKLCKLPSRNKNETSTNDDDEGLGNRFNIKNMEDENQNWGLVPVQSDDYEDGDGSRPINFNPVEPKRPISRPAPPVDHGSVQAGSEQTTRAPVTQPGMCETAILNCCILQDRTAKKNCFARYNCSRTYATNRACEPEVIERVLDHFRKAYAPVN